MMKKPLVFLAAIFFLIVLSKASILLAEGYLEPTSSVSPHGGYTTASNKCKYCHAVHLAEGSYMLTRANSVYEACDYCHGDGSGAGTIIVTNFEGHTTGKNQVFFGTAPGYVDGDKYVSTPENTFTCLNCHSVHGNPERTVILADLDKNYLLLNNPDTTDTSYTTSNTLSEWCSDCHPLMFGSNEIPKQVDSTSTYSHASSSTAVTTSVISASDGKNYGPSCRQCHLSSLFPHGQGGTGRDMLKDSFDGISLDDVCNDCHPENSLP
jgi:hypothetical protein